MNWSPNVANGGNENSFPGSVQDSFVSQRVISADYSNPRHARAILELMDVYARDPMGGGEPLRAEVTRTLIPALAQMPGAFSLLCYAQDKAVGLANCFEGFSTFKARKLINIHDIVVLNEWRRMGIGQMLLREVEAVARQRDCCKITLEVLEGNGAAQGAYRKFGFDGYELSPQAGKALFWQKNL